MIRFCATCGVDASAPAHILCKKDSHGHLVTSKYTSPKAQFAHQLAELVEEYIADCKKIKDADEFNITMIETTLGIFARWLKEYK